MTQRDDIGREVRRGFRIGNSCTPMVDSCQCMAKPIQYCKVKKIKINKLLKTRKQQVKYVDEIIILLKGSFQLFLIVKEIIFYKVPEVPINKVLNFISVLPLVKWVI